VRERLLFIPLEVKREGLDQSQVSKLESMSKSQEEGRPSLGFGREKNEMVRWRHVDRLTNSPKGRTRHLGGPTC
jgi:hypothetical protein